MSMFRPRQFLLALATLVVTCFSLLAPLQAQAQDNAPLFINLSNDDPWKVAMAAFFGTHFALKQNHPAVIFVSVQATPMFHKNKSEVRAEQFGRTVHEMLREFQAADGRLLICTVCMKATGIAAGDLIEGAEVATVKSVNELLFRPESKTLAW